jgi:predicted N-acetyltransferase YhbS
MPDMLVKLYALPPLQPSLDAMTAAGVIVRPANAWELSETRAWITEHFSQRWADEAAAGFANKPVSTLLAIRDGRIVGFGCYECTRRGFFGPTGVDPVERGKGIGAALLIACLHGLANMGYAYAIIGGVGPAEFYAKAVGATVIPDSSPGIYRDMLKKPLTPPPTQQV